MQPPVSPLQISSYVRDVPDFPKPGILFRDITPLLANGAAFGAAIEQFAVLLLPHRVEGLVAIESRGFIFGAAWRRSWVCRCCWCASRASCRGAR